MSEQFVLKTILDFASAHSLNGYDGDCARLHGHNWKIEVEIIGYKLNEIGMIIDFKKIKKYTKEVISELDHSYLNDHPYFTDKNPTAENIAKFIFQKIQSKIENKQVKIYKLTVWENDRNCVIYSK
jgi:6-pyruvoyltetrahydropterin/6-carboxytetrahydropterin synthase